MFVAEADAALLRSALPSGVALSDSDIARLEDDGQVRVWWGDTPVDIFLNSTPLHESAAARTRWERLGRIRMPFLSCLDTAIFKAFFNRTRDWSDLEEMRKAGRLDFEAVREILVAFFGRKRRTCSSAGPSRRDGTRVSAVTDLCSGMWGGRRSARRAL